MIRMYRKADLLHISFKIEWQWEPEIFFTSCQDPKDSLKLMQRLSHESTE